MASGEVNHTCCPPTCGCCPKLGVPELLEVTVENIENHIMDVSPPEPEPCVTGCHHCDLINGTWYPELSDYIGLSDTDRLWYTCWYHMSLGVGESLIDLDCDGGFNVPEPPQPPAPSWPNCVTNPPTTIDLWVQIVCNYPGNAQSIFAQIIQDATEAPVIPENSCVGLCCFGAQQVAVSEDPCVIPAEICDWLIDGVEMYLVWGDIPSSACVDGEMQNFDLNCIAYNEEGYTGHHEDPAYRAKVTVKRVM
jgi:hypothetical protein